MYREVKVLPITLGSTIAFSMFREAIWKLLQVDFFFFFFFEFFPIFKKVKRL
jgi:hypothetical protein